MSLLVEDGSGVAGAEAYISVADADAYFAARGNADWADLDTTAKEAALRKGCDYMEGVYTWKGMRATKTQTLSWPRKCVVVDRVHVPSDRVPLAIARANAELAVRASAGDLSADEGSQVTRETVGPITVEYAQGARQNPRYAAVDAMLSSYTLGGGQIAVVRC
ncbi:DnaT-like ssDNA-binding protein [Dyella kyungheensis]|uniref:DnaT-like ssDNA-binding protein n=1 Tax=Dyella kyungheensis TaxID=1242174 RepID=UPI003CF55B5A